MSLVFTRKKEIKRQVKKQAKKNAVIYTLDAAIAVVVAVIILYAVGSYLSRSGYNRVQVAQPFEIGADIAHLLHRSGYLDQFYLENLWFFNDSVHDQAGENHGVWTKVPQFQSDDYRNWKLNTNGSLYGKITPHADFLAGTTGATITAWVKVNNSNVDRYIYFDGWLTTYRIKVRVNTNEGITIEARCNSTDTQVVRSSSVTLNDNWHHVAAVIDVLNDNLYAYIDGVQVSMGAIAGSFTNTLFSTESIVNMRIAADDSNSRNFSGMLDDVRVYDRTLSDDEIRWIMNDLSAAPASSAQYDFDIVTSNIDETLERLVPRQYEMIVQVTDNSSKIISNGDLPELSVANNFIAGGERIFTVNDSTRVLAFAKARYLIWVRQ